MSDQHFDMNRGDLSDGGKCLWDERAAVLRLLAKYQSSWFMSRSTVLSKLRVHLNRMTYFISKYELENTGTLIFAAMRATLEAYQAVLGNQQVIHELIFEKNPDWDLMIEKLNTINEIKPYGELYPLEAVLEKNLQKIRPSRLSIFNSNVQETKESFLKSLVAVKKTCLELIRKWGRGIYSTGAALPGSIARAYQSTIGILHSTWEDYKEKRRKKKEARYCRLPIERGPNGDFPARPIEDEKNGLGYSLLKMLTFSYPRSEQRSVMSEKHSGEPGERAQYNITRAQLKKTV